MSGAVAPSPLPGDDGAAPGADEVKSPELKSAQKPLLARPGGAKRHHRRPFRRRARDALASAWQLTRTTLRLIARVVFTLIDYLRVWCVPRRCSVCGGAVRRPLRCTVPAQPLFAAAVGSVSRRV
jgi:hypothetical protein